jgi:type II secretory pathway pseudopilin PulG
MSNKSSIKSKFSGFTLIEIMVACSIFIIVMMIAIGSIFSLVNANRKSRALSSVVNNLNIGLESMVRDLRTGTNHSIINSGQGISFTDAEFNQVTYSLVSNQGSNSIYKTVSGTRRTRPSGLITAPEVAISSMSFAGRGESPSDNYQPLFLLKIDGSVGGAKYNSPFMVQTLITQRVLDNGSTVSGGGREVTPLPPGGFGPIEVVDDSEEPPVEGGGFGGGVQNEAN